MISESGTAAPVGDPVVGPDWKRVARALSAAGNALIEAANALESLPPANGLTDVSHSRRVALVPFPRPPEDSPTVVEAVNLFLRAKWAAGKSVRYVRTMRNSLSKFAKGRGSVPLAAVTVADVERWITRNEWNGVTRRGYLRDVRTLYNFALRRNLVSMNAAAAVELPTAAPAAIGIHTPAQVARALALARGHDLNLLRGLTIRYFTGLRSSEVDKLTEADIKTEQGVIVVQAMNAKTRRRRVVKIQPVLAAWLALGGVLPLGNAGQRWRKFTRALGALPEPVPWPHNATRHSFVSYHLSHFENAARTALEAGHSESMLFAHYREIVTPQAAAEFWALTPDRVSAMTTP